MLQLINFVVFWGGNKKNSPSYTCKMFKNNWDRSMFTIVLQMQPLETATLSWLVCYRAWEGPLQ